jgi:hypothetical protein
VREKHGRGTQGVAKASFRDFLCSLAVHALSGRGTLGEHLRMITGVSISDAAAIQRRAGLSWECFEALFAQVLRPRAQAGQHEESFYRGHRLLGVDGTEWSLRNTEAITAQQGPRHTNGKKEAAFYKWGTAVLLELGTHQPLGAACALRPLDPAQGELNIARRVLGAIPSQEDTLLLADRLYGCARFIHDVQEAAGTRCQVLVRVGSARQSKVLQKLSDGSAFVETRMCEPGTNRPGAKIRVREIRGQVWREVPSDKQAASSKKTARAEVRLWTTLLDEKKHPAPKLLELYAQRWEQELFFGELKRHTGRYSLLRAGTLQGAQAEFGALIIAASLLAEQRLKAAQSVSLPPVRLSLGKISYMLQHLLSLLEVGADILSAKQRAAMIRKYLALMASESVIKPRRSRSCQRAVCKPQGSWPRIQSRCSLEGPFVFHVISS